MTASGQNSAKRTKVSYADAFRDRDQKGSTYRSHAFDPNRRFSGMLDSGSNRDAREMVPRRGLEPPRVASHVPETCVSTNFTTSAERVQSRPGIVVIRHSVVNS